MCVEQMCIYCLQKSKESVSSFWTRVTDGGEPLLGDENWTPGPLQERNWF